MLRRWFIVICACLGVSSIAQLGAADREPQEKYPVRTFRDICYYDIPLDPDASRHKLDIYRPLDNRQHPVLIFLHGGAWVAMSKDNVLGIYGYGTVARCLAERGLVVAVPNYRLSPGVRHPEHIKDVARAFAWVYRNCEDYGGDRKQLFVGGHSAGGHLAALLATDETYLKQVNRAAKEIRGVIGVSGVYRLDEFDWNWAAADSRGIVRSKLEVHPLAFIFGDDPEAIRQASPINHVCPGLPPFLIISGGWDYPPMRRMAKEFSAALQASGTEVEEKVMRWRNHDSLVFNIPLLSANRSTTEAILQFIDRHSSKTPSELR